MITDMNHLMPAEIAEALVKTGVSKTESSLKKLLILGIMAGAYIAFAGAASTAGAFNLLSQADTYGLGRILCGAIFTGGLVIVTLAGAELFTGNCLITVSVLEKKTTAQKMLKNWTAVYIANLAGSVLVAWLVCNSGVMSFGDGMMGAVTVKIAAGKVNMTFLQCFASGILCNWLVCLAVWSASGAKSTEGKVLSVFFPIWLFATCGFEHSVANMYFIPAGIMTLSEGNFAELSKAGADALENLNWAGMFTENIIPVTLGNIAGGALFVAAGYWLALKDKKINAEEKR